MNSRLLRTGTLAEAAHRCDVPHRTGIAHVETTLIRPSRSFGVQAVQAVLVGTLFLLLALALAPRAGAAVYWGNAIGPVFGLPGTTIGRANNDGTGVDLNFIGGASTPEAVAVDTAHVYWINETDNHSIGRANLDGTGVS